MDKKPELKMINRKAITCFRESIISAERHNGMFRSLKENGWMVHHPLIVFKMIDVKTERYVCFDGECRLQAADRLMMRQIPCLIIGEIDFYMSGQTFTL